MYLLTYHKHEVLEKPQQTAKCPPSCCSLLFSRKGGENRMTKLVGGDKGRDIAYQLPSQARQIWQMKTASIYCQEKHRQTLKQHPSSFPFQTQFHSSHFSTLQPLSSTGETGTLQSVHSGSSLLPPSLSLFSLAPAGSLPKGCCS